MTVIESLAHILQRRDVNIDLRVLLIGTGYGTRRVPTTLMNLQTYLLWMGLTLFGFGYFKIPLWGDEPSLQHLLRVGFWIEAQQSLSTSSPQQALI